MRYSPSPTTDWDKNKRVNTLYLLDLTKRGAAPQPIIGAEKGHDAVFGRRRGDLVPDAGRRSGPAIPHADWRSAGAGQ